MERKPENYAQRVLRRIRVDGRTTRQIMHDVEALVEWDMPDDSDAKAIRAKLDRLIRRQFDIARRGAPKEQLYRIADEMFVLERALICTVRLAAQSAE